MAQVKADTKELFGDIYCNAEYFRQFFNLDDVNGVYYRFKRWGILGKKFGNGQKYWSMNRVKKELEK